MKLITLLVPFLIISCSQTPKLESPTNSNLIPLPQTKTNLIIDTDIALGLSDNGKPLQIDDGFSLVVAINSDKHEFTGITTVSGETESSKSLTIAKKILELKGKNLPVIDEKGGIDSTISSVQFLSDRLKMGKAIIVVMGPLTNIAKLLRENSEAFSNIERLFVLMGRSVGQQLTVDGKIILEDFNYLKDPASARAVLQSNVPVTFIPFELSNQISFSMNQMSHIHSKNTPATNFLYSSSLPWIESWRAQYPKSLGFQLWALAPFAYLEKREWIKCEMRGLEFSQVEFSSKKKGRKGRAGKAKVHEWLELDESYKNNKHEYCFGVQPGRNLEISNLLANLIY